MDTTYTKPIRKGTTHVVGWRNGNTFHVITQTRSEKNAVKELRGLQKGSAETYGDAVVEVVRS